ncbi:MAG: CRTAC1 family protein [Acidobacteria bacterium]|nr:CRTAC1 family protein [Acidobacteriota bacterium]
MSKRFSLSEGIPRRRFLKNTGGALVAGALPWRLARLEQSSAQPASHAGSESLFVSVPPSVSGITWKHVNGRSPNYYLPETTGAGCAFFDYDNDGWMDIYLVNSGRADFYDPDPPLSNALYHNNRDGTFTDVTEKAGLQGGGYGMGVTVGDYDGDGLPDLYLTQYGQSVLYHNEGNGKFVDVTRTAGVAAPGWSSSAVWFDYDGDGRLDLFVCRFVQFSKQNNLFCGDAQTGERYYCIPRAYNPSPSWLFHNNGDGTFTDVSKESGIADNLGKAWGVVATDIDNDGRMDLFVANDTVQNFLFHNRGNGKFEEVALEAGVAYSEGGRARSGMGVDSADYDQDGWMDLFVANVDHERYSVYHNNQDRTFKDEAMNTGIGRATWLMSGWGLKFFDFDNDGNVDIFLANGHPDDRVEKHYENVSYEEPLLLFRNTGNPQHRFENISAVAGPVFQQQFAARGLAIGDFDNDGASDVLIAINNAAPILLRNNAARGSHWLGVRLVGKKANRDAVGALITYQAGDLRRSIFKVGAGSYLASHDPRVVLGIGRREKLDWVQVRWPEPSGRVERFAGLPLDQYITLEEGSGKAVS